MKPEPNFMGVRCTGPDEKRAKQLESDAWARETLAKFYRLDRDAQLVVAAATEQLLRNSESKEGK